MLMSQTLNFHSPNIKADSSPRILPLVERLLARGKSERFVQIMQITPAIAADMLKCNLHNRPLVHRAVEAYASMMTDGLWKLTIESIGFDRTGILQNGQHRLMAIVNSGVAVWMTVWFGIEPTEFEVIDQGRKRTAAHLISLSGFDNAANRASLALCIICIEQQRQFTCPSVIINDRVAELSNNPNGHFNLAVLIGMRMKKVTNPAAAALASYFIMAAGAKSHDVELLMGEISSGEGLHDVRHRLREWLKDGPLSKSNDRGVTVKRAAAIINGWNSIKKGNKTAKFDWPHVTQLPAVRT